MRSKVDFRLLLITDRKLYPKSFEDLIETMCKSGVKAVQLREKDLSSKDLLQLAKRLRNITQKYHTKLLINDRLDVTMLSKADGLHSPERGTPVKYIRRLGSTLLCGKSVHSLGASVRAEKDGYDYLIFGPVFRTASKMKYGKPKGILELRKVCEAVRIPVFAVGGITPKRALKSIKSGAYGAAVIGAIMKSLNLKRTINEFKGALGEL